MSLFNKLFSKKDKNAFNDCIYSEGDIFYTNLGG